MVSFNYMYCFKSSSKRPDVMERADRTLPVDLPVAILDVENEWNEYSKSLSLKASISILFDSVIAGAQIACGK